MKLMVQKGTSKKHQPFHPKMILRNTGYARGHWQVMMFNLGLYVGDDTIRERGFTDQVQHYLKELRRTGHKVVSRHQFSDPSNVGQCEYCDRAVTDQVHDTKQLGRR